jgi:DNA-binding NtrC family response regulator
MAEGGTLFLDEIDSLSMGAQAKLLRVLQERMYKPLGSDRFHRCDINVVAATNTDLDDCVHRKQFRTDLYFRLNVMQLPLPPLRERAGDIEVLARHFLRTLVPPSAGKKQLSASAVRKLKSYQWPGNVRELSNVVHRATVLCDQPVILPCHIMLPTDSRAAQADASFRQARTQAIESFERSFIDELLAKHGGNISHAARDAGQERRSFGRLVKKYQLARKK